MNKAKLLESIQTEYRLFKKLLAGFDTEQLCQPGAVGKWSIKDTVAHIVVHERRMIQWMQARLCGEQLLLPQPYDMPEEELNRLNEEIYQENLHRPLEEVLHGLDKAHEEALRLVVTSPEEDLLDPARFQLQGGEPLWEAIAANTFSHYEEHGRDIKPHRSIHSKMRVWKFKSP
jgi:hypothetical protein